MISDAVSAGVRMNSQTDETIRPKANPVRPVTTPPAKVASRKMVR